MQLHGDAVDTKGGSSPLSPAQSGASVAQGWIQNIVQGVGSILSVVNQQKLASTNLQRIQQGQAPITYQDVPGLVPTVQVQGGVDQGTQQMVLLLGGAALVAFLLMGNRGGARRARA